MDYKLLLQLRETAAQRRAELPAEVLSGFDNSFNIEYAHNSTAIEGNTLTLIQTKAIIEDGLSVGGKMLREIYEVANHAKSFAHVQKCVAEGKPLDENTVKDIHALIMENIHSAVCTATWRFALPAQATSLPHRARCTVR